MTEQDPFAAPADGEAAVPPGGAASVSLEDRLSDAALAAMMGDPYEVGLRVALDDGVAAVLPVVARELAWLDRAVAATQGRLSGLAAAPAAAAAVTGQVPGSVTEAVVLDAEFGARVAAGGAVASLASPGGVAAVATAAEGLTRLERVAAAQLPPVDLAASRAVTVPSGPAAAAVAAADGEAAPGFARLDWGGVDWGRLAAPPAIAVPATPVPEAMEQGAASPATGAGAGVGGPAWSAAPSGDMAAPSAAPDAAVMAPAEDGGFGGFAGRQEATMPGQAPGGDSGEAGAGEAADSESGGIGGVLEVDGALLGRFIAEQLGRAADRPPSGMTGFDPLVSPAWMSASVG